MTPHFINSGCEFGDFNTNQVAIDLSSDGQFITNMQNIFKMKKLLLYSNHTHNTQDISSHVGLLPTTLLISNKKKYFAV